MYFDIGSFATGGPNYVPIPDFSDESVGTKYGEIKDLNLAIDSSFNSWIHFDVVALAIDQKKQGTITGTIDKNPASHDVTWKGMQPVPEPSSMVLWGTGLLVLATLKRRFSSTTSEPQRQG